MTAARKGGMQQQQQQQNFERRDKTKHLTVNDKESRIYWNLESTNVDYKEKKNKKYKPNKPEKHYQPRTLCKVHYIYEEKKCWTFNKNLKTGIHWIDGMKESKEGHMGPTVRTLTSCHIVHSTQAYMRCKVNGHMKKS